MGGIDDKTERYTIRQLDGRLIGPLSFDAVQHLVRTGRLARNVSVAVIGGTFLPIGAYPELARLLKTTYTKRNDTDPSTEAVTPVLGSLEILQDVQPACVMQPDPAMAYAPRPADYNGHLNSVYFGRLLYFFHTSQETGLLLLQHGDLRREIYFLEGVPQLVELPAAEDDLEERLLARGACDQTQLAEGKNRCAAYQGRLSDHLVAMGYLDPYLLYEVLQEQFRDRLLETFGWFDGFYQFFADEPPPGNTFPLKINLFEVIKQGIQRWYALDQLRRMMEPFYNRTIAKVRNRRITLEQLAFSPREARIYNHVGRTNSLWALIDELQQEGLADLETLHRFLFFLAQIESVIFDGEFLGQRVQDETRLRLLEAGNG